MGTLNILHSYLKDLNYPRIELMSENEMVEIFDKQNRLYFLTWFVQKLDSDIVLPLDRDSKVTMLANILYDNGFCSTSESTKFVLDSGLDPEYQVQIFYKMLHNLRSLVLASENSDTSSCENYLEQMTSFTKRDMNLFPALGPLQSRRPEQRREIFKKNNVEIEKLKKEIECLDNKNMVAKEICLDEKETGRDGINSINKQMSLLVDSNFLINSSKDNKRIYDDKFKEITGNCNQNLSNVLKLYESKAEINKFSASDDVQGLKLKHSIEIVKNLAKLSENMVKMD